MDADVASLDPALARLGQEAWPVPCGSRCSQLEAGLAAGATSIPIDTAYADYRASSYALLWSSPTLAEIVSVSTVAAASLTIAATANAFDAGAWVMPCRRGYLVPAEKRKYVGPAAVVDMTFEVVDNAAVTRTVDETAALTTYDGYEVLIDPVRYAASQWTESIDPDAVRQDSGTGIFEVRSNSDFNEVTQDHGWQCATKQAAWLVRQFLHAVRGRQVAFLVPTWRKDLTLSRAAGGADTTLYVVNRGFATMGLNTLRTYVMFRPAGAAPVVRKVTGIAAVSATEESIEVNTAPGAFAAGTDFCWVDKCRLGADDIEIEWRGRGKMGCNTRFVRVTA